MKIGIIGSQGRMGQALVDAIAANGHTHAGGVDKDDDLAGLIAASDVLVDFSSPGGLEASLDACDVPCLVVVEHRVFCAINWKHARGMVQLPPAGHGTSQGRLRGKGRQP